jgi:hypothetical protein
MESVFPALEESKPDRNKFLLPLQNFGFSAIMGKETYGRTI